MISEINTCKVPNLSKDNPISKENLTKEFSIENDYKDMSKFSENRRISTEATISYYNQNMNDDSINKKKLSFKIVEETNFEINTRIIQNNFRNIIKQRDNFVIRETDIEFTSKNDAEKSNIIQKGYKNDQNHKILLKQIHNRSKPKENLVNHIEDYSNYNMIEEETNLNKIDENVKVKSLKNYNFITKNKKNTNLKEVQLKIEQLRPTRAQKKINSIQNDKTVSIQNKSLVCTKTHDFEKEVSKGRYQILDNNKAANINEKIPDRPVKKSVSIIMPERNVQNKLKIESTKAKTNYSEPKFVRLLNNKLDKKLQLNEDIINDHYDSHIKQKPKSFINYNSKISMIKSSSSKRDFPDNIDFFIKSKLNEIHPYSSLCKEKLNLRSYSEYQNCACGKKRIKSQANRSDFSSKIPVTRLIDNSTNINSKNVSKQNITYQRENSLPVVMENLKLKNTSNLLKNQLTIKQSATMAKNT